MALTDKKILSSDFTGNDITSLANEIKNQGAWLKARFDAGSKNVVTPKFNALIDALIALGVESLVSSSTIKGIRLNALGTPEFLVGADWIAASPMGHVVQNAEGTDIQQTAKLRFAGASVQNVNGVTVVTGYNEAPNARVDALEESVAQKADASSLSAHTGDTVVHVTSGDKAAWNAKTDEITASATLTAAGWAGTSAPYTQTLTVTGMTADLVPELWPVLDSVVATALAQKEAFGAIGSIVSAAGSVTVTCLEDKPGVDIPVMIRGIG